VILVARRSAGGINILMKFPIIIVSGGQTGADRSALDFAIAYDVANMGWCPKGRLAEDGAIPDRYNLQETLSASYPPRTRANVELADATVIFAGPGKLTPGSKLTVGFARDEKQPCLVLQHFPDAGADADELAEFLEKHQPVVLNVAGSRESKMPGIGEHVLAVMVAVFKRCEKEPVDFGAYPIRGED
jgi:hypothetical protein